MFRRPFAAPLAALLGCLVALRANEPVEGKRDNPPALGVVPATVKSDYFLFAHLNAKAIRESSLFADVKEGFARANGVAEWDKLWARLDRKLDLALRFPAADIDSITYCLPDFTEGRESPSVTIVACRQAIKEDIGLKLDVKPDARGLYALDPQTFLHFPNDKTAAILDAALAQKYLDGYAKNPTGWPWTAELARAASGHVFFTVFRPDTLKTDLRKERKRWEFAPLMAARTVALTGDIKGKEVRLAARATFADGTAAGKARHKVHALIGLLGDGIDGILAGKVMGDLGAMRPAVKEAERALAAATVEVDGSDLVASVSYTADFKIDPVAAGVVKYVRVTLPRITAQENLEAIGLALANYEASGNRFLVHGIDADGVPIGKLTDKPLLSWRVAILPFIEQSALYNQFKLDEPWDSANNKKLIDKMPKVFAPVEKPGKPGYTHLQMVIGPAAMRPGKSLVAALPDGTSNTIAVVEAAEPVIWSKPDDVMFLDKELPKDFRKKFGGQFSGGFHVLLWDGSARFVADSVSDKTLRFALCPDDGNVLGSDW